MEYNNINTLADIRTAMAAASSTDGETSVFELKGNGTGVFGPAEKRLLVKEICAFANTYGGVVVFHGGLGDNLQGFPAGWASDEFNKVEDWLSSCLESRLSGIRLKIVEEIFVIDVPESKTKPHQAPLLKKYFYRHNTSSIPMPEIMISSMYRSQDYLNFRVEGNVSSDKGRVTLGVKVKNLSRLSGSQPKIQIQSFGQNGVRLSFHDHPYFEPVPMDSFGYNELFSELNISRMGRCETNSKFAEKTLYPSDEIYIKIDTEKNDLVKGVSHFLLRTDCMFKEGPRHTDYFVIKLQNDGASLPILSTQSSSSEEVIRRFAELRDAKPLENPVKFLT